MAPPRTPPPAPGATPGPITVGKYTPDWASLIANDSGFLQDQSYLGASNVANASQRDAQIQRALVQFGGVPDIAGIGKSLGLSPEDVQKLQESLGPGIQDLAKENTDAGLSTESRLAQANTDAVRQIKNQLNARGLLNSGETGYQLGKQQQGYSQAEYDANQKLLDYLNQYQQGYLSAQTSNAQALGTSASNAADRQFSVNQGSPGTQAVYDHTAPDGTVVYKDTGGTLYSADGSKYTPPPEAPVAPPLPRALGDYRAKLA